MWFGKNENVFHENAQVLTFVYFLNTEWVKLFKNGVSLKKHFIETLSNQSQHFYITQKMYTGFVFGYESQARNMETFSHTVTVKADTVVWSSLYGFPCS